MLRYLRPLDMFGKDYPPVLLLGWTAASFLFRQDADDTVSIGHMAEDKVCDFLAQGLEIFAEIYLSHAVMFPSGD